MAAIITFWCTLQALVLALQVLGLGLEFDLHAVKSCPPTCTCDESAYTCVAVNASDLQVAVEALIGRADVGLLHLVCPSLTTLPAGLLHGLDVEGLVISANLVHLDNETFASIKPSLAALSLAANALTSVPPRLPPFLHRLDLSDNRLSALRDDAFAAAPSLRSLRLDGNPLTSVGPKVFASLNQLLHLGLSRCGLVSPPFPIPSSAISSLSNLRVLHLESNLLETLPDDLFSPTSILQDLHLSRNRLRSLPAHGFSNLSHLSSLYLDGNHLTSLPLGGVGTLPSLQILDLSGNWLRSVPAEGVGKTPLLRQLFLRDNAINWMHADAFVNLKHLEVLELEDNLLHCDCNLQSFASWLSSRPAVHATSTAHCQEPPELQGHTIADLTIDQMRCTTTTADPYYQSLKETDADVTWWKEEENSRFHVVWQFSSPPVPYECDSIFIVQGEELRGSMPVSCDSTKLDDPRRVLLDVDADFIASGSRLCLVLLSHSNPLAACSFLTPEATCPMKINVNWVSERSTSVNWDITTDDLCKAVGSLHLKGEIVANTSVSCSQGSILLPGIRSSQTDAFACLSMQAPYYCPEVCAPVRMPPTSSSTYIVLGAAICTVAMIFLVIFALGRWCLRRRVVKSLEPWPSLIQPKEATSEV